MKSTTLKVATLLGGTSVILGAFGAHALKESLDPHYLQSFETGVRYQMYHALVLLVLAMLKSKFEAPLLRYAAISFTLGVLLFSGSIYGLSLGSLTDTSLRWLGPVTPLGGLLLITGWMLLFVFAISGKNLKEVQ